MNQVSSIFSQMLRLIPRGAFAAAVDKHQAERHARGFRSWTHLVSMLFCQLGHAQSLREITGGLAACEGKLRHLGVGQPPKRSTLSYANESTVPGNCSRRCFITCWRTAKGKAAQRSASSGSNISCRSTPTTIGLSHDV
ncbi:MAG: DUF4372 domain-containing protein [Bryobacteraceae bacterium]|nr:DUF4372 domain-containing protein [Bryobacteraceae bacterium]